jgi:hypothetical protein
LDVATLVHEELRRQQQLSNVERTTRRIGGEDVDTGLFLTKAIKKPGSRVKTRYSLGRDRMTKACTDFLAPRMKLRGHPLPHDFRSHELRRITTSKLFNLGFPFSRINQAGLWFGKSAQRTFLKSYYTERRYASKPKDPDAISISEALLWPSDLEEDEPTEQFSGVSNDTNT